jgi:hypothetical protein
MISIDIMKKQVLKTTDRKISLSIKNLQIDFLKKFQGKQAKEIWEW